MSRHLLFKTRHHFPASQNYLTFFKVNEKAHIQLDDEIKNMKSKRQLN